MYTIGILIFPQVEELDFVGPFEVLSYANKVQADSVKVLLIAETAEAVKGFNGMQVIPAVSFTNCPALDILVVPGGRGRITEMKNPAVKEFVVKQAKQAKYVASVCTGAFILAEAGLLDGKKATTYHTALAELAAYPSVIVTPAKVVHDGAIITGAGVSSGLELGFYLLKQLFSKELAREVAKKMEYDVDVESL